MKTTLRVENGAQLAAALNQMSRRASRALLQQALMTHGAEPMRAHMASIAPRHPGAPDLASNIVTSVGKAESGPAAAVVVGPSTGRRDDQPSRRYDVQGKYLEFGTSNMSMQPFARPTFDSVAPRVIGPICGALWHGVISGGFGSTRGGDTGGGLL